MGAKSLVSGILCIDITFLYSLTPHLASFVYFSHNIWCLWMPCLSRFLEGNYPYHCPLPVSFTVTLGCIFSASVNSVTIFHLLSAFQNCWNILSANEDRLLSNLFVLDLQHIIPYFYWWDSIFKNFLICFIPV